MYFDDVGRPKRLLVFVNPFGGKKSAVKIFAEQVKPLFEDAQIQLTIQGDLILSLLLLLIFMFLFFVLVIREVEINNLDRNMKLICRR